MEICPDKYNKYLERLKQDGYAFEYVPKKYITEEFIFMAQQTRLYYSDIPTVLATRIFEIYETMGE